MRWWWRYAPPRGWRGSTTRSARPKCSSSSPRCEPLLITSCAWRVRFVPRAFVLLGLLASVCTV
eukprot:7442623-Pyramimonas_sp.AAC.1